MLYFMSLRLYPAMRETITVACLEPQRETQPGGHIGYCAHTQTHTVFIVLTCFYGVINLLKCKRDTSV